MLYPSLLLGTYAGTNERKSKGGIIGYDGGSDGIPYQPHSEIQWYRDKDGKLR
jgi:hypothetical protein